MAGLPCDVRVRVTVCDPPAWLVLVGGCRSHEVSLHVIVAVHSKSAALSMVPSARILSVPSTPLLSQVHVACPAPFVTSAPPCPLFGPVLIPKKTGVPDAGTPLRNTVAVT